MKRKLSSTGYRQNQWIFDNYKLKTKWAKLNYKLRTERLRKILEE